MLIVIAVISRAASAPSPASRRSNLKRLWAYSSIANIGYALVGLAAGGAAGVQSMLVFMVLYIIDVTGFFACLAALNRDGQPMETIRRLRRPDARAAGHGPGHDRLLLSAIGLPPFSGFWAKVYVFKAAIDAGSGCRSRWSAWSAASWRPSTICA